MRKDYEKLFSRLEPLATPAGLFYKIMARIREEELLLSIKRRLVFFAVVVLASVGALIPVANVFWAEFASSGFYQFLSLAFSDLGIVTANWQEFGLALLESLPVISIAGLLTTLLVFLWSFKHFAQAIKVVVNQPQLSTNN